MTRHMALLLNELSYRLHRCDGGEDDQAGVKTWCHFKEMVYFKATLYSIQPSACARRH
jgi:hypothetical protein